MGLSISRQIDTNKYFSISTIDTKVMKKFNIEISKAKLKEIVQRSPPYIVIMTGSADNQKRSRHTKVYRYEDFANLKA